MQYDFTTQLDRRGQDALAVEPPAGAGPLACGTPKPGFEPIPMWVADMNFAAAPCIPAALCARAAHPAYGYFVPREEYFSAILRWQETRNGAQGLTKDCIGYENGVLGGLVSALRALCSPGDRVLLHSPTYIGFTSCIENNGFRIVHSPLVRDAAGVWRMDLADMEAKLRENHIHAAVLCSPHNPTGRVWERAELEAVMALYAKYDVYVISDEIWSDLILGERRHTPTQSVSEDAAQRTVALYAPSKTFNLAGLVGAYRLIRNPYLRDRVAREASLSHYNEQNVLSMHALIAAYSPAGAEWLDALRPVLAGNAEFALACLRCWPGVEAARPEGTYMLFADCAGWCAAHGKTLDEVLRAGVEAGVLWQDGRPFFGPCHIRMNLALPRARVEEAFARLDRYVFRA
jgi:cystathionine beta-lyase